MNNTLRSHSLDVSLNRAWNGFVGQRGKAFGFMIFGALIAFEIFNFSTTEFALHDVLGDLKFLGIKWATMLSIAFCGIDFAGIARIFTPEQGSDEPAEVWYLFGAWLLAAAMNASLTWWGVSVAISTHASQGAAVVGGDTVRTVVPVFVAIMVWVIRILIIGSFSIAGDRMFSMADSRQRRSAPTQQPAARDNHNTNYRPVTNTAMTPRPFNNNNNSGRPIITTASNMRAAPPRPAPRPEPVSFQPRSERSEPTYHNLANVPDPYEDK
ncbi:MAG: hypothetical protein CVU44_17525 [Chloroflexi bacterium HGW-Chloroflexi-6]|nr:MAG: hypothetical protein CVU44_17525 [Chloroflexi bacterium HGW-Chloroflexi-6]